MWEAKVIAAVADADVAAETNWKHKVTPDWSDLIIGSKMQVVGGDTECWALKFSPVDKIYNFQHMGEIFCVEFQRYPLKFHTKYLTHTLKDIIFIQHQIFKSS